MTKISTFVPDTEINGKDKLIGTDFNNAQKTKNFKVEDLGTHFNLVNGSRNFEYLFYNHLSISQAPVDGAFYANGNEQDPNNITHFFISKKTSNNKDVSSFFDSITAENPFDLIISQSTDLNTIFFFNISSVEYISGYYKLTVSEVFFPQGKTMEFMASNVVFNLKATNHIHNNLSGLNDGDYKHLTAVEKTKFDNLPNTFVTNHSQLLLNDGTNPHGTTKSDVGLGNVNNTNDISKPISTATQTAINLKEDSINKSTLTTDSESSIKFPVWSAIVSYFDINRIKTILGITTLSGSNTGDQTSIVGITGTKAQFNTAVTDGDIQYVGDAPTAHTHTLSNVTDVTMTVVNLNSLDDGVNSNLHFHDTDRARANHTGTQLASTISDIQTTITNNASVITNTAKVTNATHTGDVTGSTALTLATVNSNVGAFGNATTVPMVTVNAKGLITAVTTNAIQIAESQVTNLTTDLANKQAMLVSGTNIKTVNGNSLLGSGDVIISGGTLITANSIFNFLNEEDRIINTISNASITNANVKSFSFIPIETPETSLDDFSLNGLSFSIANIIDNVSFDIIGTALNNASGNYTIKYLITI